jgi:uncharacterized repeat protein (TIGR01451 family)
MKRSIICGIVPMLMLSILMGGLAQAGAEARNAPPADAARADDLPMPVAAAPPQPELRLLRSDETGVVLELHTPDFEIESIEGDLVCHRLTVGSYATTDEAGSPQMPVRGAMLGVPPSTELSVTVLEGDIVTLAGRYDLCPAPRPIVEQPPSGTIRYRGQTLERDEAVYASDAFYPASSAEIASTGFIRSQRVAQLRLHPFRYNPATGQLRHVRRLRVRVDFDGRTALPASKDKTIDGIDEGPFEQTLRQTLLNAESARAWRTRLEAAAPASRAAAIEQQGPAYRVEVDQDGLYEITPSELAAAGLDVDSLDPHTLRLHNRGQEVAIHVAGQADGSFAPGDAVLFYGEKTNTRYTDVNVYWLTHGTGPGRRMAQRDGSLSGTATDSDPFEATHRWEEDVNYLTDVPGGAEGDLWFADSVYASGGPDSESYTFTVRNLATVPYSPTVRGQLFGWSRFSPSSDHHTRVHLNGHLVDDATWDGWRIYQFERTIPRSYLIEGTNVISVECPFDLPPEVAYDIVYPNWFEIDYRDTHVAENDVLLFNETDTGAWEYPISGFTTDTLQIFDVTSPTAPVRILRSTVEPLSDTFTLRFEDTITSPHRYLALPGRQRLSPRTIEADEPSSLRSPANGADYVIITHGDFTADVLPLAEHRRSQGLRTAVVDVADVYDAFNHGIFNPVAIRDFLAYAYKNWTPPAPSYVLLVGDGHYDFKDNFGRGAPVYVPPYLADADPWMGETAADNRYVCVSGDDTLPDMHLGRLPVKTRAEARTQVDKILAYERDPAGGDWNRKALFVADNADDAGDFAALSDAIADHYLPAPYTPEKAYYGVTHPTPVSVTRAITRAINEGRLLVNYVGHASPSFWAWEKLLEKSDLGSLTETPGPPLMVPLTCLEGYYIHPSAPERDRSSFAESIVRVAGGGAIASWSPTGLGVSTGHDLLEKGLFQAIFFDGVHQVGPATTRAKLHLYANSGGYRELLDTYLLFGDPALHLNVLKTDVGISKTVDPPGAVHPGDRITYTLTYSNAGPATAHHVVITDLLPSVLTSPTVSASGAEITSRPDTRFVWDVADLAAGDGGTITVTAAISPTVIGAVTNTATIATSALDRTAGNNVASVKTDIIRHHVYLPLVTKHGETSLMD